jgi:hypothetical protein
MALRVLVDPETDRTILRNVVSYMPNVTASHLMRLPTYLHTHPPTHLPTHPPTIPLTYLPTYLPA